MGWFADHWTVIFWIIVLGGATVWLVWVTRKFFP
jgi:hypothetical protein